MKQIVILSGKGGTGKTFVSASFASLAQDAVFADCDVDASNLHLLLGAQVTERHPFTGGRVASVAPERCTACGRCVSSCRFEAISLSTHARQLTATVDELACEGCGVCDFVCPVDAIELDSAISGQWYTAGTAFGPLVSADLYPGEENSGKLVEHVRRESVAVGRRRNARWIIVDGPPGTGCAPKSAVTGADYVVFVTEPTPSGLHDLERVIALAAFFRIPGGVIVNKSTIDPETAEKAREIAVRHGLTFLGTLPYDRRIVESVAALAPYPSLHQDAITAQLSSLWDTVTATA